MTISEDRLRSILSWVVIVLVGGPVTGAVLLGVLHGDSPCILCWAERTSMVLIGLVGLFVIRYGPRPRYLGMAILLGAWGTFMAIRHSALHLARDVGQGFSATIFGLGHAGTLQERFWMTGMLYGLPLAVTFARRDWEHAVGAHYMINMIPTLMVFLEIRS